MRLIATDLDGTLLGADGTVSPRTRRALDLARTAGVMVVPVTARLPIGLREVQVAAGFTEWALCSNAAISVRLDTGEIGHAWLVEPEAQRAVATVLLDMYPDAVFASLRDAGWKFVAERGYLDRMRFSDHKRDPAEQSPHSLEQVLSQASVKLVARGDGWDCEAVVRAVRALHVPGIEVTFSGAPFVEIVGGGVTKASGLAQLCGSLGVEASEVLAFGDALNDVDMLAWAGHGVAVANGSVDARSVADEVTLSNVDDGVAIVIERMLQTSGL